MDIETLHKFTQRVAGVAERIVPGAGVSIGDPADSTTWNVQVPAGTPEAAFRAAETAIRAVNPDAPTAADVIAERKRRLAAGFDYDFGDARGVHRIGTTDADMVGWREVTDYANALIDLGDTTTKISITTDTGHAEVTAPEWQAVMLSAAQSRQRLWSSSFVLQAMNQIPADYADDAHWS